MKRLQRRAVDLDRLRYHKDLGLREQRERMRVHFRLVSSNGEEESGFCQIEENPAFVRWRRRIWELSDEKHWFGQMEKKNPHFV